MNNRNLLPGLFFVLTLFLFACDSPEPTSDREHEISVIAYYSGDPNGADQFAVEQLDQVIHSFLHLQGNKLALDDVNDSIGIANWVGLKERNPELKVLLSLGGWGGCKTCSDVFSGEAARQEFAQSVLDLLVQFKADGIDLDWEYPGIEGYPGHTFKAEDKQNFTYLVEELRETLGDDYVISFAAAGFDHFFKESIEWDKVMPLLDNVNIMTYDLVSGFSTVTGHHTPLYSTQEQLRSTDRAVTFLDSIGVPREKMVIGAAFYARVWENVANVNNGLYQSGKFKQGVGFSRQEEYFASHPGFEFFWDEEAQAPYAYNADSMWFATYDDSLSVALKTRYAQEKGLGGIMFWELGSDKPTRGLLESIDLAKK
jgi:chitinase